MARPTNARPGDALRARQYNRVKNYAYTGATPSAAGGITVRSTIHGVSFSTRPSAVQKQNAINCEHTTAEQAPLWGVVELYETSAGYESDPIGACRRPSHYGFGWCGVLLGSAGENEVAFVQTKGLTPVLYLSTGDEVVGGRMGCIKDSYYAIAHAGGPFIVRELHPDSNIAVVEITGLRLDYKMVDLDAVDPLLSGPYHTIIYRGRAIGTTSPGVTVTS